MIIKHSNSDIGYHFGDTKELPNNTVFKLTKETIGESSTITNTIHPNEIELLTIVKPSMVISLHHKDIDLNKTVAFNLPNKFLATESLSDIRELVNYEINEHMKIFKIDPISDFHLRANLVIEQCIFITENKDGYIFIGRESRFSNFYSPRLIKIDFFNEMNKNKNGSDSLIMPTNEEISNMSNGNYDLYTKNLIKEPNEEYYEFFNSQKSELNNINEIIDEVIKEIS